MATNWALQSNGATAAASSTYASSHAASFAIDGSRTPPTSWNTGGIWHSLDAASTAAPQVLTVTFPQNRLITEFVVTSARDTATNVSAVDTLTELAAGYGLTNFTLETKDGSGNWTVRKTVINNNRLMRRIPIAPVSCFGVRISVTLAASGQARIAEFEAWDAPSPSPGKFSQVLYFGNSITVHPKLAYWWNPNAGMAASEPSTDYVHVMINRMKANGQNPAHQAFYNAEWERNWATFDKTTFDYQFSPEPDLVVVALGDNVSDYSSGYDSEYAELLEYIQSKAPYAQIVTTGSYYQRPEVDEAQAAIAGVYGLLFVPQAQLYTLENQSALGNLVMGDDGIRHAIDNPFVATHPGDRGMRARAASIYNAMYPPVAGGAVFTPTAGRNIGSTSVSNGIYAAETGFSGGSIATQNRTYATGTIDNPPPKAILDTARFANGAGASFTETVAGLTTGQSYKFRIFSTWDGGAYAFTVAANGASKGTFTITAGAPGVLKMFEFDAVPNSSGEVVIAFTATNSIALVNAIDYGFSTGASDTTAPVVTNFSAVADSTSQITLSYAATDAVGVTGVDLDFSLTGEPGSYTSLLSNSSAASPFVHTNRATDTLYFYRFRAKDVAGNRSPYSVFALRTLPAPAPGAPTAGINIGDATPEGIYAAENLANVGGATSDRNNTARVYNFSTIPNPPSQAAMQGIRYALNYFTYTVTNLAPSSILRWRIFSGWDGAVPYTFTVKANNASVGTVAQTGGNGAVVMLEFDASTDSSGTMVLRFDSLQTFALVNAIDWRVPTAGDTLAPTMPTASIPTVVPGGTQLNLSWTASSDNVAVAGYEITRSLSSAFTSPTVKTTANLTYPDTTVQPATTYFYKIRAYDAAGNYSPYSNTVSQTTASNSAQITTTSPLPPGTGGANISRPLQAAGGTAPYTFALVGGTFPGTVSSAGVVTYNAAIPGSYSLTVSVTDAAGVASQKTFALTITAAVVSDDIYSGVEYIRTYYDVSEPDDAIILSRRYQDGAASFVELNDNTDIEWEIIIFAGDYTIARDVFRAHYRIYKRSRPFNFTDKEGVTHQVRYKSFQAKHEGHKSDEQFIFVTLIEYVSASTTVYTSADYLTDDDGEFLVDA